MAISQNGRGQGHREYPMWGHIAFSIGSSHCQEDTAIALCSITTGPPTEHRKVKAGHRRRSALEHIKPRCLISQRHCIEQQYAHRTDGQTISSGVPGLVPT